MPGLQLQYQIKAEPYVDSQPTATRSGWQPVYPGKIDPQTSVLSAIAAGSWVGPISPPAVAPGVDQFAWRPTLAQRMARPGLQVTHLPATVPMTQLAVSVPTQGHTQIGQGRSRIYQTQARPIVFAPAAPDQWAPSYPDWLQHRRPTQSFQIVELRPVIPVPHLSWRGIYDDRVWQRTLPTAATPWFTQNVLPLPEGVDRFAWRPTAPDRIDRRLTPPWAPWLSLDLRPVLPVPNLSWKAIYPDAIDRKRLSAAAMQQITRWPENIPPPVFVESSWQGHYPAQVWSRQLPRAAMPSFAMQPTLNVPTRGAVGWSFPDEIWPKPGLHASRQMFQAGDRVTFVPPAQRAWFPRYRDQVLRPRVHPSQVPSAWWAPQGSVIPPVRRWDAEYPDWFPRPTLRIAPQGTGPFFPLVVTVFHWDPEYPDLLNRPATRVSAFPWTGAGPLLQPSFDPRWLARYPDRFPDPWRPEGRSVLDPFPIPNPPSPDLAWQGEYPDWIARAPRVPQFPDHRWTLVVIPNQESIWTPPGFPAYFPVRPAPFVNYQMGRFEIVVPDILAGLTFTPSYPGPLWLPRTPPSQTFSAELEPSVAPVVWLPTAQAEPEPIVFHPRPMPQFDWSRAASVGQQVTWINQVPLMPRQPVWVEPYVQSVATQPVLPPGQAFTVRCIEITDEHLYTPHLAGERLYVPTWSDDAIYSPHLGNEHLCPPGGGGQACVATATNPPPIVVTPPTQPTIPSVQALSASGLVDSVGINLRLHFDLTFYDTNFPAVKAALADLGITRVRDLLVPNTHKPAIYFGRHNELGLAGIRTIFIVPLGCPVSEIQGYATTYVPDCFDRFEGPNEPDLTGLPTPTWVAETQAIMQLLLPYANVIAPALTSEQAFNDLGVVPATFGNIHNYYAGRHPGTPGWGANAYGSLGYNVMLAGIVAPGKPVYSTETGYAHEPTHVHFTPPSIIARYLPRLILDSFRQGIPRTYLYELADSVNPALFGLMDSAGTQRPAYVSVKALLNRIADPGPIYTPAPLPYQITGGTGDLRSMALGKRNGTYLIALWLERSTWDVDLQIEFPIETVGVTLTTSSAYEIPGGWQLPTGTPFAFTPGPSQFLSVTDNVMLVEIRPV